MIGTNPGDLLTISLLFGLLTLLPVLVVTTTSFLKIALVLLVLRNAVGIQQVPPTIAIYGISLAMTAFIMAPTLQAVAAELTSVAVSATSADSKSGGPLMDRVRVAIEPMRNFMTRFARPDQLASVLDSAKRLWPPEFAAAASKTDFLILLPAFVISELQTGYEIAFLVYVPFVVIDLLVSNLLMALGMQQVSPQTVSIPLKLLLFVMVDGWSRLLYALATSYQP
jgi:type III secretion protein R